MFRRREDSLFDNEPDSKQEAAESATVVSPSAASPAQPAAPASSAPSYAQSMPRPPVAPSQPAGAQPAASFRPIPSAPINSDLGRNRMPEAPNKSSSPASAGISSPSAQSADKSAKSAAGASSARRVLTVGNDILLKGEIATCDRLVIEGKVEATLNDVHTVEIAENGSFKGSANIEDAEIRGLFEGDLVVRNRLIIYATGKVRGKITYGEIEIERGGEMTGEIKTNASAASGAYPSAPRARQTKDDKVAA